MAEPVTLDIYEGEQVAILGPNGSGKTRLVEILTGRWPLLYGNEVRYDFGDDNNRLVSENIKVMTFRDSYGDADTTYYLQKRWNQHDIDEDTPMVNGQPLISLSCLGERHCGERVRRAVRLAGRHACHPQWYGDGF